MNKQNILGILDLTKHSKLGEMLFFVENLKIKQAINKTPTHLALISQDYNKLFSMQLPLIHNYLDFSNCFIFNSLENFSEFSEKNKNKYKLIFPSEEDYKKHENPLDTTLPLKDFFSKNNFLPQMSSKPEFKNFSEKFLKKHAENKFSVVAHLKTQANQKSMQESKIETNADLGEWYKFFQHCEVSKPEIKFFLIGNDALTSEISSLSNIIITKDKGLNLVQELSLIESANLFMGICSGPFQIALFNRNPYVVFKNPEHHADKMILELSNSDKFSFATDKQIILRKHENFDTILENFNKIYEK